ncbi:MAG TPA: RNA methyltransferase [Bacillales bacterium]|nr:RNA methyltransferase [Bacillales bacterium]
MKIESNKNAKVKRWKKLHTKKGRKETGRFMLEGWHLIEEALAASVSIVELIVAEGVKLPDHENIRDLPQYEVPRSIMNVITETETPQGIAAVCEPIVVDAENVPLKGGFLFVDAVQDPGNVGTLIRTADAAGLTAVVLGEGCADLYNGKVIRATQGSLFHLPVFGGDLREWTSRFQAAGIPVYGSALTNAVSFVEVAQTADFALIVGNEGSGVNPKLLEAADQNLYVPITGKAESLNVSVAAAILMYRLKHG